MGADESRIYTEEGRWWLQISPGHAVSVDWLENRAPQLYARWCATSNVAARGELAAQIEQRLDELEPRPLLPHRAAGRSA